MLSFELSMPFAGSAPLGKSCGLPSIALAGAGGRILWIKRIAIIEARTVAADRVRRGNDVGDAVGAKRVDERIDGKRSPGLRRRRAGSAAIGHHPGRIDVPRIERVGIHHVERVARRGDARTFAGN